MPINLPGIGGGPGGGSTGWNGSVLNVAALPIATGSGRVYLVQQSTGYFWNQRKGLYRDEAAGVWNRLSNATFQVLDSQLKFVDDISNNELHFQLSNLTTNRTVTFSDRDLDLNNPIFNSVQTIADVLAGANVIMNESSRGSANIENVDLKAIGSDGNEIILFRLNNSGDNIAFGEFGNSLLQQMNFNFGHSAVDTIWGLANGYRFNNSQTNTINFEILAAAGRAYFMDAATRTHEFTGDVEIKNELKGARQVLAVGDNVARSFVAGSGFFYQKTINGVQMTESKGYAFDSEGSIVGLTFSCTISNYSATGTLFFGVYIDGTFTNFSTAAVINANGEYIFTPARQSRDLDSFLTTETIQTAIFVGGAGTFDVNEIIATIDIQLDT